MRLAGIIRCRHTIFIGYRRCWQATFEVGRVMRKEIENVVMPNSTLADRCLYASDEVGSQCSMSTDYIVQSKGDLSKLNLTSADHSVQTKGDVGMEWLILEYSCVQTKGNSNTPCPKITKQCEQTTTDVSSLKIKSTKGYAQATSYACSSWFMLHAFGRQRFANVHMQHSCIQALADAAFYFPNPFPDTHIPCNCVQTLLKSHDIGWRRLLYVNMQHNMCAGLGLCCVWSKGYSCITHPKMT